MNSYSDSHFLLKFISDCGYVCWLAAIPSPPADAQGDSLGMDLNTQIPQNVRASGAHDTDAGVRRTVMRCTGEIAAIGSDDDTQQVINLWRDYGDATREMLFAQERLERANFNLFRVRIDLQKATGLSWDQLLDYSPVNIMCTPHTIRKEGEVMSNPGVVHRKRVRESEEDSTRQNRSKGSDGLSEPPPPQPGSGGPKAPAPVIGVKGGGQQPNPGKQPLQTSVIPLSNDQMVAAGLKFRDLALQGNEDMAPVNRPQYSYLDFQGRREVNVYGRRMDIGILDSGVKSHAADWTHSGIEPYKRLHLIIPPAGYEKTDVKDEALFNRWPYGCGLGCVAGTDIARLRGTSDNADGLWKAWPDGQTGYFLFPDRLELHPRNHNERIRFLSNMYSLAELDKLGVMMHASGPRRSEWDRLVKETNTRRNSSTLMVSGMSYSVSEAAYLSVFARIGYIIGFMVMTYGPEEGDKPRGQMLVEYAHPVHCMEAISQLNGHEVDGRRLEVKWSDKPFARSVRNAVKDDHVYLWFRAGGYYDKRHISWSRHCKWRGLDYRTGLIENAQRPALNDNEMEEEDHRYGYGYVEDEEYQGYFVGK